MAQVANASSAGVLSTAKSALLRTPRITSVDILRGLVMVIMALDHTRDFFTNIRSFEPEAIAHTYPALFYTRWITHFCAPMFFFLAGTGAYLYKERSGSVGKVSRFLWTRGLWLIFLEWTIIDFAWTFQPFYFGGVIWSLGVSMLILAAVVWLPEYAILAFGLLLVGLHDLFDAVKSAQFGSYEWLWTLLHRRGFIPQAKFFVLFPIIPWVGVMAAGYFFGRALLREPHMRRRLTFALGVVLTLLFVVLRGLNGYGNPEAVVAASSPGDWQPLNSVTMTIVYFLDVEKYPPSLQFLLMTIGPSLILLSIFDRVSENKSMAKMLKPLLIFGRVPLFFYVIHLFTIHLLALAAAFIFHQPTGWLLRGGFFLGQVPEGSGYGLPMVYAMWLLVVVILYFLCRWFADLKQRRRNWWLSYL